MKFINDNFGHSEGDEALKMTANALLQAAAAVDKRIICSRFGGDEFVVVLQGRDYYIRKELVLALPGQTSMKKQERSCWRM
jgi:diguanylate cyclase (GGDEF)-like protein